MPTDRYTRFVLTLIAAALIVIAARPLVTAPSVQAANAEPACGADAQHPCFIVGLGPEGTVPIANSHSYPLKVLIANSVHNSIPVVVSNPPLPLAPRRTP
ncbi:MAG TPA: hypothetical protein VFB33_09295 [Candidatus Binataceae bacterium]|nr:hypothetical protein [Candidatus Binataceae bacterium]